MKYLSLFIFLSLSVNTYSEDSADSKFQVHAYDPDLDLSSLNKQQFNVTGPSSKGKEEDLLSPKKMEQLFKNVEMNTEVNGMDQMDRDLLFLKLKKYPLKEVQASYPKIPKEKLEKLQRAIQDLR